MLELGDSGKISIVDVRKKHVNGCVIFHGCLQYMHDPKMYRYTSALIVEAKTEMFDVC